MLFQSAQNQCFKQISKTLRSVTTVPDNSVTMVYGMVITNRDIMESNNVQHSWQIYNIIAVFQTKFFSKSPWNVKKISLFI